MIEAVLEDMATKTAVFRSLHASTGPRALLATNTSYMDVNAIAEVTTDPSRVLGLHFFAPANVMRLLEVVRGREIGRAHV